LNALHFLPAKLSEIIETEGSLLKKIIPHTLSSHRIYFFRIFARCIKQAVITEPQPETNTTKTKE
jgi:hypothetical protein